jgi:hypothetical protein
MDRDMMERHLALAERHVALGLINIDRQERTIARMQRNGHDTDQTESLLANFMTFQAQHEEHRDRLLKLLG